MLVPAEERSLHLNRLLVSRPLTWHAFKGEQTWTDLVIFPHYNVAPKVSDAFGLSIFFRMMQTEAFPQQANPAYHHSLPPRYPGGYGATPIYFFSGAALAAASCARASFRSLTTPLYFSANSL